ncbi:MAG: DUF1491 family protein [Hyphomicrobiaceae bacterium]|nr:DUF1491 family protein [Hyphomicrobiaceae bacterium]
MRLKSSIWVMAYVRAMAGMGAPAFVARRGDAEAGAIFIKVNRLDGTADLYGPAPAGNDRADVDRMFAARTTGALSTAESEIDALLHREVGYDGDIWIVEVEDRAGRHGLGDALTKS